ncbi:class I SAM-dependent methyltransferase [Bacillus cereus]|uniref:class I SAM-dependent methyltransferase n=1 Tax=Bacillus cereus TaxID=1396 RepID=UPI0024BC4800|nr:class I SAM-dependent methyltransferase [Bacillus cereus]
MGHISWSVAPSQHYHVGIFELEKDSMEDAQNRTVEYMARKVAASDLDVLLDIGCGSGLTAVQISKKENCKIVGINISEKQLAIGKKLISKEKINSRVKLMNMDAHQLNFKSGMFDGAYALESIMHMNREKVLSEVHRVLKNGAPFSLCDWYVKKSLTPVEKRFLETITLGKYITKEQYFSLYQTQNFMDIEIEEWSNKILPTYKYWTTITDEMKEKLPDHLLYVIEENSKVLSDIAIEKLGYLQVNGIKR